MTKSQSKRDKRQARRLEASKKFEARAERQMNDTKLDALRRPFPRRLIALVILIAAISTTWTFSVGAFWPALSLLIVIPGWFLLQGINRGFMDLPDQFVDERIISVRDNTYREAYMWLGAIIALLSVVVLLVSEDKIPFDFGVSLYGQAAGLFWTMAILPGVLFALKTREI